MGIMIYRDMQAASAAAATLIAAKLIEKPNAVLGLSACSMAVPVYRNLAGMTASGILDWSEASIFHTSELLARRPGLMGVMTAYLNKNLYQQVNMNLDRVHAPTHNMQDMDVACTAFESALIDCGGMDTLLLFLGQNGHIAFNGPAREFSSFTHVELLPQSTMEECARMLTGEADASSAQAITMGLSTLLSAKHIVLCAFGRGLSGMVERMLSSAVSPAVPASFLQLHPSVTYILDEEAAINL